jgi:hypothetical protein
MVIGAKIFITEETEKYRNNGKDFCDNYDNYDNFFQN